MRRGLALLLAAAGASAARTCDRCADGGACCDPTSVPPQMCPGQVACCDCGTKACACPSQPAPSTQPPPAPATPAPVPPTTPAPPPPATPKPAAPSTPAPADPLQAKLEAALKDVLDKYACPMPCFVQPISGNPVPVGIPVGSALQLAWKSETMEFTLAHGGFIGTTATTGGTDYRAATVDDTFLFGSGTKAYTAAAIFRLAEQGVLSLDDPVAKHVDPILPLIPASISPEYPTTWEGLFGVNGSKVTVRMLLHMRSGLTDYDTIPGLDDYLIYDRPAGFTPRDYLNYIVTYAKSVPTRPAFDFEPGAHVAYTSTSFIVAGIILANYDPQYPRDWAAMQPSDFFSSEVVHDDLRATRFLNNMTIADDLTAVSHLTQWHCIAGKENPPYDGPDAWIRDKVWIQAMVTDPPTPGSALVFWANGTVGGPLTDNGWTWDGTTRWTTTWRNGTNGTAQLGLTVWGTWGSFSGGAGPTAPGAPVTSYGVRYENGANTGKTGYGVLLCAAAGWEKRTTVVGPQNAQLLGYTSGNIASTARDMARFFWDLTGPAPRVVSPESLAVMQDFHTADSGWAKGQFQYGTGIMRTGTPGVLGTVVGHGGSTYGFTSVNGYADVVNASISIVSNTGIANGYLCTVLDTAAHTLGLVPDQCSGAPAATVKLVADGTCHSLAPMGAAGYYRATCSGGNITSQSFTTADCSGSPTGPKVDFPEGVCLTSTESSAGSALPAVPGVDAERFTCVGTEVTVEAFQCACKHNGIPPVDTRRSRLV